MHRKEDGPLTLAGAKALMDEVIAEMGEDFIYSPLPLRAANVISEGCYNVPLAYAREQDWWDAAPIPNDPRETSGCLVGSIMTRWGGMNVARGMFGDSASSFRQHFADEREVGLFLRAAQESQDSGNTWGEARRYAYQQLEVAFGQPDVTSST